MISLQEAINLQKQSNVEKPPRSERAELLGKLYNFYERDWKVQTWKVYKVWLGERKHTMELMEEFKKKTLRSLYWPKTPIGSFCAYPLGHIPTDDLYYLISIAQDKENRKESFNKWLYWAVKNK